MTDAIHTRAANDKLEHLVRAQDVMDRITHLVNYSRNMGMPEAYEEGLHDLADALYGHCHADFKIREAE